MALAALLPLGQAAEMKTPGDRMFARYFENETKRLGKADLAEIRTLGGWSLACATKFARTYAVAVAALPL